MKHFFKPSFFKGNRHRFQNLQPGLTVLSANQLILKSADLNYDFVQDPNFWYLSGLDYAGLLLVIAHQTEFIILPPISWHIELFDGSIDKDDLRDRSQIENIYDYKEGINKLKTLIKTADQINAILPPKKNKLELNSFINPAQSLLIKKIKYFNKDIKINDLTPTFKLLRSIKSQEEIEAISKAVHITLKAINYVERLVIQKKITSAYQVAYELEYYFKKNKASGHAFSPIIANTEDATTIHFQNLEKTLKQNNLIVIDVGAEFNHYKADITRTIAFNEIPKRQQLVFLAVKRVQEQAIKILKPGLTFREIQEYVVKLLQDELLKLGLLKKNDPKKVSFYFPHSFGHSLGLETHDLIDYSLPLQEGMVITMEPGLYIKEEGIAVRVEDDIVITKDGCLILGNSKGML